MATYFELVVSGFSAVVAEVTEHGVTTWQRDGVTNHYEGDAATHQANAMRHLAVWKEVDYPRFLYVRDRVFV